MSCSKACSSDCGNTHCGSCCGGSCSQKFILTSEEANVLQWFAVLPFLPVASDWNLRTPYFFAEQETDAEKYSPILLSLQQKGLIEIDYTQPLCNYDYAAYSRYPMHGSMALTGDGQDILDQLDIQELED